MRNLFLQEMLSAFPEVGDIKDETIDSRALSQVLSEALSLSGEGDLPSWFGVTDLAVASIGTAGLMLARLLINQTDDTANYQDRPLIKLDRRLASFWFDMTLRPKGWTVPSPWDAIAGDYQTKDGWIRLHTNAPLHRKAALSVLGQYSERSTLEPFVARWESDALEASIIEAGGCAATMRDLKSWSQHPQGVAVSQEPLIHWKTLGFVEPISHKIEKPRPLSRLKVLDLTRVLAGPVAGRFLAAYGAQVLRIDPPVREEPGVIPEVTLGKRCAGLNLKDPTDRCIFEDLLAEADVLLHGYRPGALIDLGYAEETLHQLNPRLINVSLNAYGWSGPWATRRGFDSLVQMSSGIADYGMEMSGSEKPVPLPVQALDHATGYLLAATVLHALQESRVTGQILSARLSLARVAHLLTQRPRSTLSLGVRAETEKDIDPSLEMTTWGPATRVKFPLEIEGTKAFWDFPASSLRSSTPTW